MANFIIKKTERDFREAAHKAGLSPRKYSGLTRSEEEGHDLARKRGGDEGAPWKPIAINDGGQADREMMLHAKGITEEQVEKHDEIFYKPHKFVIGGPQK